MAARKPRVDDPATPDIDESQLPDNAAAEPETTTDYTRRAGGYVLTEQGWVREPEAAPEGGETE